MKNTNVIHFVVKMPVPAENTEKFITLAAELVEKSQKEPGNIYYNLTDGNPVKETCLGLEDC